MRNLFVLFYYFGEPLRNSCIHLFLLNRLAVFLLKRPSCFEELLSIQILNLKTTKSKTTISKFGLISSTFLLFSYWLWKFDICNFRQIQYYYNTCKNNNNTDFEVYSYYYVFVHSIFYLLNYFVQINVRRL